ncbi:amylo-alpha-1,6-glucosidase [Myxacorys almedinensis]|uniref:Amylo-alpha-1,6-glucosidase n=1 Tax=Myxacorys almedinensis A TaxID=2690445 RepID=A0A8J8CJ96_9CYAN|nr:amylo-alpha-1,6-glucosidase [Myxacorys almedinensis]NDJ17376.1 amylo-alpha-1,6-glucosidase [Myxacorys almedinensis A]
MRISVGPPILTINHGSTFMVSDLAGQIHSEGYLGIFSDDTRFLSHYASYIDGHEWLRISSATTTYYGARVYLANPTFTSKNGEILSGELSLTISRVVESGIHEELELTNHRLEPVSFSLEIVQRSDFADVFEVESQQFVRRGRIETVWNSDKRELSTTYQNEDFYRCLIYRVRRCSSPVHYANGRITFEITLQPGEVWKACCNYVLSDNEHVRDVLDYSYQSAVDPSQINTEIEQLHADWCGSVTAIDSSDETLNRLYQQSVEDLGALRLFDYDYGSDIWIAAAGVPKYVTLFGRDSLITGLQTMMVHSRFAVGALKKLAELQATELDDWRDAEPGKILHEVRQGELAKLQQIPHTPYYGTADATPLFLITLHETWKWSGDDLLLNDHRDVILGCLEWIDRYGDLDGDGFQEYKVRSPKGIENQGWKDSGDAIVNADGTQVDAPKALCELQGYAFDAQMRMAEVFEYLGECDRANNLRTKATHLQQQFEDTFWCEDLGFYAFTLDPEKRPVKTISSNVGHCLWSGIIRPDRAARVVERLLQPDMWSGWGIRTLSTQNPAYNPFSYHRGTIWPHDNGIIAMGFRRYGFAEQVAQVAQGIFDTANYFASYRLPELYAGIPREPGTFPAPYLEANVPQAWAAASVFHLLQAMLGLQADAPHRHLYVDPHLPNWLSAIKLERVEVGEARVDLKFWREGTQTRWDATVTSGTLEIKSHP